MHVPSIGAMQFLSEGLRSSYGFAAQFAGPGGHVATLSEVASARAGLPLEHPIWNSFYTTTTCEYFGMSAGGVPIVIVAHGKGPINDQWTAEYAYIPVEFRADRRPVDTAGRIPLPMFRKLENGDFGPVSIIEFSAVMQANPEGWSGYRRLHHLDRDLLLQARLGPDWYAVAEKLHQQTLDAGLDGFDFPRTIHNSVPYSYWKPKGDLPLAHLLVATTSSVVMADGEQFVGTSFQVHERSGSCRFIGVRKEGSLAGVHQGPELLSFSPHRLLLPFDNTDTPLPTFFNLMEVEGQWYSCVRKEGCSLDSGQPEFKVTSIDPVGQTGKLVVGDARMFFRYDMADVMFQAPDGANAYYLGEPRQVGNSPEVKEAVVHFCRVKLDMTQRCVSKAEIEGTFDQQMQLLARIM